MYIQVFTGLIQFRLCHVTTVYMLVVEVHVYTCVYIIVLWLLSWCVLLSPHCILSPTVTVTTMYIMNQVLTIEGEGKGGVGPVGDYHDYHS